MVKAPLPPAPEKAEGVEKIPEISYLLVSCTTHPMPIRRTAKAPDERKRLFSTEMAGNAGSTRTTLAHRHGRETAKRTRPRLSQPVSRGFKRTQRPPFARHGGSRSPATRATDDPIKRTGRDSVFRGQPEDSERTRRQVLWSCGAGTDRTNPTPPSFVPRKETTNEPDGSRRPPSPEEIPNEPKR